MRGTPWLCFSAEEYLEARRPEWETFERDGHIVFRDFGRGESCFGVNVDLIPSNILDTLRAVAANRR